MEREQTRSGKYKQTWRKNFTPQTWICVNTFKALSRTSKSIRLEALPLFFAGNAFEFFSSISYFTMLEAMPSYYEPLVANITIHNTHTARGNELLKIFRVLNPKNISFQFDCCGDQRYFYNSIDDFVRTHRSLQEWQKGGEVTILGAPTPPWPATRSAPRPGGPHSVLLKSSCQVDGCHPLYADRVPTGICQTHVSFLQYADSMLFNSTLYDSGP